MRIPALALSALAALLLAGCDRPAGDDDIAAPADTTAPAPADDAADDAGVTMRYSCDDGYAVAVMGDVVRVGTADGREIELQRVADSAPPLYAGEAMEFAIGSEDAMLAQDEGANWTCRPE
jgi:hypothetical protein